jgi:hypothetical protein
MVNSLYVVNKHQNTLFREMLFQPLDLFDRGFLRASVYNTTWWTHILSSPTSTHLLPYLLLAAALTPLRPAAARTPLRHAAAPEVPHPMSCHHAPRVCICAAVCICVTASMQLCFPPPFLSYNYAAVPPLPRCSIRARLGPASIPRPGSTLASSRARESTELTIGGRTRRSAIPPRWSYMWQNAGATCCYKQ